MDRYSILTLSLIISNFCFSQNTYYQAAKVTKSNNEVLVGYIEKISESGLNPELKFKEKAESETFTTIPSAEVQELIFINDSSVFNRIEYTHKVKGKEITEYRLAKLMILGYANLFKLQLPSEEQNIVFEENNTYVYILLIDTSYYVLKQIEELDGTKYKLNKKYQGMLSFLLKDCPELKDKVWDIDFTDKQIYKVIKNFNELHPEKPLVEFVKKEKPIINHGIFANMVWLNNTNSQTGNGYGAKYKFSVINPEVNEKLAFIAGGGYNFFSISDSYGSYISNCFSTIVGGNYYFNKRHFSPYVFLGISTYFFETDITGFFSGSIGAQLYRRVNVSVTYEMSGFKDVNTKLFHVNLGYNFGKTR